MNALIIYLLKVSLAISLVTLPYYVWLRNDPALNIKRFYLIGGIILSWLFPLLAISKPEAISNITQAYLIDPYTSPNPTNLAVNESSNSISPISILLIIYLLGLFILTIRYIFMFRKISEMNRENHPSDKSIVYTNLNQPFTFISKIFIPNDLKSNKNLNSILIHERAHLQQWHIIDLLISESNLLLTWFNPFSWLISRMIKENHEHLADRSVLSRGVNPAHYKAQLLNHATGVEIFRLANQFNYSLTKKRFNMMKQIKSPRKGFIKYLALVPAIIVTLGLFTAASAQMNTFKGKVIFENGYPATGASIVVAGGTQGAVADLDGTFSLKLEGNPELVISFVGYQTEKVFAKALFKKDIVLHPKTFEIDLKDVKASEPGRYNVIVAKEPKESQPEFVVDGKVVKEIESLNPDDIKQINVIKDPNSPEAKKYMAENGVIMISMKDKNEISEKKVNAEEAIFYVVEEMPSFPGGKEKMKGFIEKNQVYPEKARKKGLSGEVYTQFTVDTKGKLVDIEVARSTNDIFNEAALDVIRAMPIWSPGKQRGKPVSVKVTVPIRFTAEKD
jgi:bla regulator protein blaR1